MTSSTGGAAVGLDFNQLLRESRHLESAMEGVSAAYSARPVGGFTPAGGSISAALRVPSLQRNLQQLGAASRRLARQQVPTDAAMDSQAQLLLSAKGIDLRKQQRALKDMELSLPAARTAQPTAGIASFHPLDIERFLQQQQQLLCHSVMEEAAKVVSTHTHARQEQCAQCDICSVLISVLRSSLFPLRQTSDTYRMHDLSSLSDDWEMAKREILDSLGFRGGKSALSDAGAAGEKRKQGPALQAGPTGPVLAMEQAIYAKTIQDLNRSRVRRSPVNLIGALKIAAAQVDEFFSSAAAGQGGLAPGDVADCWDVLQCMVTDAASQQTDELKQVEPLGEKVYAGAWGAPNNAPEHGRLQEQLVEGAKRYSQQLFEAYVRHVVAKYPEARKMQHGKPTFVQQIAAYVSILSNQLPAVSREVLLDGVAFWPQVYFAFRCGHVGAALELLHRQLGQAPASSGFGARTGSMGLGVSGTAHHEQNRVLVEAMEKKAMRERTLHASLWIALHEEYQRELANAVNRSEHD
jgi:hypothetical protein